MRRIESRNNPLIVRVGKLGARKYREEQKEFFFEGAHLLEEYLRFGHEPKYVFVCDGAEKTYASLLERIPEDRLISVSESVYQKITSEQAPQGICTVSSFLPCVQTVTDASMPSGRTLILESVRDNGNVGTVLRTAAAFGWNVVLSTDCADLYAPKTVRASMGALFSGNAFVCSDLCALVASLRDNGRKVFAAALRFDSLMLGTFPMRSEDVFIIGNEGQGISEKLISACDGTLLIPMTENAESLNASVAASVLMWEGARSDELWKKGGKRT